MRIILLSGLFIAFTALTAFTAHAEERVITLAPDERYDIILQSDTAKKFDFGVDLEEARTCLEHERNTMMLKLCGGLYGEEEIMPGYRHHMESQYGGSMSFQPDENGEIRVYFINLSGKEMEFTITIEDEE